MTDKLIYILPSITMCLYALTAVAFACRRDIPWTITYAAYALANVGLIWASMRPPQ